MTSPSQRPGIERQLAGIRETIAALAARGVATPGPPVPLATIEAFEARAGVTLPDELRVFAFELGLGPGGGLSRMDGWSACLWAETPGIHARPCLLEPGRIVGRDDGVEDAAQGAIEIAPAPQAWFPSTLLILAGPNRGRVIDYDMDSGWCQWVERVWPLRPAHFLDWVEHRLAVQLRAADPLAVGAPMLGSEDDLVRAVTDDTLAERVRALALATVGDAYPVLRPATLAVVHDAFTHPRPPLRAAALAVRVGRGERVLLFVALEDPSPVVRGAAIRLLARQDADDARRALARLVDDPDDEIAAQAFRAIWETPLADLPMLVRLFERPTLRPWVVQRLRAHPVPIAVELLARALSEASSSVRLSAIYGLGVVGLPAAVAPLAAAQAIETDPKVRDAIAQSLRWLARAT